MNSELILQVFPFPFPFPVGTQVEMLYQRYFLRMNQSNTTHILALLLALILALSCTHLVFTTLQIQRSSTLMLELMRLDANGNQTGGNLTTTTMKPPMAAGQQIAPSGADSILVPGLNSSSSSGWMGASDLESASDRELIDSDVDDNGRAWRRQKRKHYRRQHKHRYKHKTEHHAPAR